MSIRKSFVTINSQPKAEIYEYGNGEVSIKALPACTLGEYFCILTWLEENKLHVI